MSIQSLKSTLGMGARTNKYRIILNAPGGGPTGPSVDILAKSATMPGRGFADVQVWVQGRELTVAGDATYDGTWSCTFMDTEDHMLRNKFIAWMDYIDSFDGHTRGASSAPDYMTEITIQQLSTIDNSMKAECKLQNAYVKNISEITYSDETSGVIEFTAEFNYSHWI
jgi:hypothetical protein